MITIKKKASMIYFKFPFRSLAGVKLLCFADWEKLSSTAQLFAPKPTSGLELRIKIASFCEHSQGICVKSPN